MKTSELSARWLPRGARRSTTISVGGDVLRDGESVTRTIADNNVLVVCDVLEDECDGRLGRGLEPGGLIYPRLTVTYLAPYSSTSAGSDTGGGDRVPDLQLESHLHIYL